MVMLAVDAVLRPQQRLRRSGLSGSCCARASLAPVTVVLCASSVSELQ